MSGTAAATQAPRLARCAPHAAVAVPGSHASGAPQGVYLAEDVPLRGTMCRCAPQGVYLAEDVGKCDQYCTVDARWAASCELHRRLYGKHNPHPGNVYYVLCCRVALGYPAITTQTGRTARHRDTGEALFPINFRELGPIPGAKPPTEYHSLIAVTGGSLARFREFVLFHGDHVSPEYLLAYQRRRDGSVLRA